MENAKTVVLTDGRTILLEDDHDLTLSLLFHGHVEDTFIHPYPSGGYGGGSLQLSPSEAYLIFSYFSGESEEGFALFRPAHGRLEFLYDSGYLYGEDAHYRFVEDERLLVQTFRTGTWYEEYAQTDGHGGKYYDFGELNLFHPGTCQLERHTIRVYPSDDWVEEQTDMGPFLCSGFQDGQFHVILPWGKAVFPMPLRDTLVIRFA